jgi:hypothetical protein
MGLNVYGKLLREFFLISSSCVETFSSFFCLAMHIKAMVEARVVREMESKLILIEEKLLWRILM